MEKTLKNLTNAFMTVFAVVIKKNPRQGHIFWVIEPNLDAVDYTIVKFYDAKNNLLHEDRIENTQPDFIDEAIIRHLNKTTKKLLGRAS
ncbi:MAG TPA: hypothetical protein DCS93_28435 [Microscillaceae bacterium]|nr:hypothetical protein [Microscillaceae bacterium]